MLKNNLTDFSTIIEQRCLVIVSSQRPFPQLDSPLNFHFLKIDIKFSVDSVPIKAIYLTCVIFHFSEKQPLSLDLVLKQKGYFQGSKIFLFQNQVTPKKRRREKKRLWKNEFLCLGCIQDVVMPQEAGGCHYDVPELRDPILSLYKPSSHFF